MFSVVFLNCHTAPILKAIRWLKMSEWIQYKFISITYKILITSQPTYLSDPISRSTRSSTVTLLRPSVFISLKITNRSFRYSSAHLWNQLLRQAQFDWFHVFLTRIASCVMSPVIILTFIIVHHSTLFHSRLKTCFSTNPFHHKSWYLITLPFADSLAMFWFSMFICF